MASFLTTEKFRNLYPFESRYFSLKGKKYHYVDEGKGSPVVMVHGNPTWSFYYRNLIIRLKSSGKRAIAPDHIGCGLSDKPGLKSYDYDFKTRVDDFTAFMEHIVPEKPVSLVVHDWGGAIAMAYAVNHPNKIDKLVILNTAAFFPPAGKAIPSRLRIIRDMPYVSDIAVLGGNLFARSALYMATGKGLDPDVKKSLIAPYDSWKNRIATLQFVKNIPLAEKDPAYQAVKVMENRLFVLRDKPMLILWGMRDFVFDSDYYYEWKRRFPHARSLAFKNAGHYVLEDERETLPQMIDQFLSEPAF